MGNLVGWNTGPHAGQLMTVVDSHYMGLVQDGVDSNGVPVMKHKTRLTVESMPVPPVGGVGSATGFDTVGDYLQVQTWSEEGYRPPLDIYYDELLMSYEPIPFPGAPRQAAAAACALSDSGPGGQSCTVSGTRRGAAGSLQRPSCLPPAGGGVAAATGKAPGRSRFEPGSVPRPVR
jgi:hypothetical protein